MAVVPALLGCGGDPARLERLSTAKVASPYCSDDQWRAIGKALDARPANPAHGRYNLDRRELDGKTALKTRKPALSHRVHLVPNNALVLMEYCVAPPSASTSTRGFQEPPSQSTLL
jgi:hypothetical protein